MKPNLTWKGKNKGETDDRRAEKLDGLKALRHEYGQLGSVAVQGLRMAKYMCLMCGTINELPLTTQATVISAPCRECWGSAVPQERYRGTPVGK